MVSTDLPSFADSAISLGYGSFLALGLRFYAENKRNSDKQD